MSVFVSQTQDELSHAPDQSIDIDLLNRDQLRQLDPCASLFRNDEVCMTSFNDMSCIAYELVLKSIYVVDIRKRVACDGMICQEFAALFVDEMLREQDEEDYNSVCETNTADYGYKQGTHSQYTWACGVILYSLLCGPPKNDTDTRYVKFYNSVDLGVRVIPSPWFGSVHNRTTWCHLNECSQKCILKLINIDSNMYKGIYHNSFEARRDPFFRRGPPSILLQQILEESQKIGAYPERTITVRAHERKKKKKGKTMKQIIRKQTDISSFKEILNIQKQDMADFKASKAIGRVIPAEVVTTDKWNAFWTAAAKMEQKKRRKSLTVTEKKKRKSIKARKTILKRMTVLTKPVTRMINDQIEIEYNV